MKERFSSAPDTIAIVGLDDPARAKTHFKQRVVTYGGPQVVGRDGRVVSLTSHFDQLGWLDSATVIGHTGPAAELAYVRPQSPTALVDLGFKGAFVGSLD